MIVKTYKNKRKIVCYIRQVTNGFIVCTGKPSDINCLGWFYKNIKDAELKAKEYLNDTIAIN